MAPNVALVYGTFYEGNSERDIKTIQKDFPGIVGLEIAAPVAGSEFNFDSLMDSKFLIVCTSSQLGMPPPNFRNFAHHLLTAATRSPGCLSHLQHAVYGNGDPMYYDTYMNMPRYMDLLLEQCGSRRFYARGEFDQPHAPLDTDKCCCTEWSLGMWAAAAEAVNVGPEGKIVPWDALWAKQKSEHHHNVTKWDLTKLEKKMDGKLPRTPSMLQNLGTASAGVCAGCIVS